MSIETYTAIVIRVYIILFLCLIPIGILKLLRGIQKKSLKYWWVIPHSMIYSIFAVFSTFIASMAYNDPADPNYSAYESWELGDFVFHDIKMLAVWLLVGILFYFVFEKECKKSIRTGCGIVLIFLTSMFVLLVILSFVAV